jgi:hypothetical protein
LGKFEIKTQWLTLVPDEANAKYSILKDLSRVAPVWRKGRDPQ